MNRNVITAADVENLLDPSKGIPKTLGEEPPAGYVPPPPAARAPVGPPVSNSMGTVPSGGAGATGKPGAGKRGAGKAGAAKLGTGKTAAEANNVKVPTSDDYLTKLLKYIPVEILAGYLFVEDLITTNVKQDKDLQTWLFWTLVAAIVLTVVYEKTVMNIVRGSQVTMGAVGLTVYVFATGGWFATMSWYADWYSGIALVLFAFLVAIIKLPDLPTEPSDTLAPTTSGTTS